MQKNCSVLNCFPYVASAYLKGFTAVNAESYDYLHF